MLHLRWFFLKFFVGKNRNPISNFQSQLAGQRWPNDNLIWEKRNVLDRVNKSLLRKQHEAVGRGGLIAWILLARWRSKNGERTQKRTK